MANEPLRANVEIAGMTSWQVEPRYSDRQYGRFTRLLNRGNYALEVQKAGYQPQTISNIAVGDEMVELEIELTPIEALDYRNDEIALKRELEFELDQISDNTLQLSLCLAKASMVQVELYNILGQKIVSRYLPPMGTGLNQYTLALPNLVNGIYVCCLKAGQVEGIEKVLILQ